MNIDVRSINVLPRRSNYFYLESASDDDNDPFPWMSRIPRIRRAEQARLLFVSRREENLSFVCLRFTTQFYRSFKMIYIRKCKVGLFVFRFFFHTKNWVG